MNIFRLKKSTMKLKYWNCHSNGCVANVHTDKNDHFIRSNGQHHHMPEQEQITLIDFLYGLSTLVAKRSTKAL